MNEHLKNCNYFQELVQLELSADKGVAIVTQDAKLYTKEAERQLNNTENYRPLPIDP